MSRRSAIQPVEDRVTPLPLRALQQQGSSDSARKSSGEACWPIGTPTKEAFRFDCPLRHIACSKL